MVLLGVPVHGVPVVPVLGTAVHRTLVTSLLHVTGTSAHDTIDGFDASLMGQWDGVMGSRAGVPG